jgi:hypothetical protein
LSDSDPGDLYLVFGSDQMLRTLPDHPGVREIGPYSTRFARMVVLTTEFHGSLVERGYWILPATAFAEICGFDV